MHMNQSLCAVAYITTLLFEFNNKRTALSVRALCLICMAAAGSAGAENCGGSIPALSHAVVKQLPHDTRSFTQGLVLGHGRLYESTGLWGQSSLRAIDPDSGKVLQIQALDRRLFGEGLALHGGRLWQLSWKAGRVLVYQAGSLALQEQHRYRGEGWGLTSDGRLLIMSDGSDVLTFRDEVEFRARRRLRVRAGARPVRNINELEYAHGMIYANLWGSTRLARIDPQSGCVNGWLELAALVPEGKRGHPADVLNGIAWDPATDLYYVTGKRWPQIHLIRILDDAPE